jgi:hypothetical protein
LEDSGIVEARTNHQGFIMTATALKAVVFNETGDVLRCGRPASARGAIVRTFAAPGEAEAVSRSVQTWSKERQRACSSEPARTNRYRPARQPCRKGARRRCRQRLAVARTQASRLPAPILAERLGLHHGRAAGWVRAAGSPYADYVALRQHGTATSKASKPAARSNGASRDGGGAIR